MKGMARRAVEHASTLTTDPFTKGMIWSDSRGFFERRAQHLIEITTEKAAELKVPEQQWVEEVGNLIALETLRAVIADRKKRQNQKKGRR